MLVVVDVVVIVETRHSPDVTVRVDMELKDPKGVLKYPLEINIVELMTFKDVVALTIPPDIVSLLVAPPDKFRVIV